MSNQEIIGDLNLGDNIAILEEFLELNPDDLKENSLRNYKSVISMFITYLGNKHFFELTERDLMKYKKTIANNPNISLETKLNRFNLTKRFLKVSYNLYLEEIAEKRKPIVILQFLNNLDKKTKFSKDESNHKKAREDVYMTKDEITLLFNELRIDNYQYYLMFRILLESGPRKLGVLSLDLDCHGKEIEYYLYRREIYIKHGKTGKHIYYCSEDLKNKLLDFVKERRTKEIELSEVFYSTYNSRYGESTLNNYLKRLILRINKQHGKEVINPKITIHSFRRTLNNFRVDNGCNDRDCTILLCQSVKGVNYNHYVDKSKGFQEVYDKYNPYFQTIKGKERNLLQI